MYVYISGPLTSSGFASSNIRDAVVAGIELRKLGHTPVIPHVLFFAELIADIRDEEFWLQWDLDLLERCDAILRLPGESRGADIEVIHAEHLGLSTYYSVQEIIDAYDHGDHPDRDNHEGGA